MSPARRSPHFPAITRLIALALVLAHGGTSAAGAQEAAGDDFGRLFHSPAQRRAIDAGEPRRTPARETKPAPALTPPVARARIDGILRRSDGRDSVWLNGELQPIPPGLRLAPGDRRELIPAAAPQTRLRVGDSWPIATETSETPALRPERTTGAVQ